MASETTYFKEQPLYSAHGALDNKTTTTNVWQDVGTVDTRWAKTKHFAFVVSGATLQIQILGSIDGGVTFPITVESSFDVAVSATPTTKSYAPTTAYYTHLKVQADPKVDNVHGTVATQYALASF